MLFPGTVSSAEGLDLVDVIDRSEIDPPGSQNAWELLANRRACNSFGFYATIHPGSRCVAIPINGRRLTHGNPDPNPVPASVTDRIEILSDHSVANHGPEVLPASPTSCSGTGSGG